MYIVHCTMYNGQNTAYCPYPDCAICMFLMDQCVIALNLYNVGHGDEYKEMVEMKVSKHLAADAEHVT